MTNTLAYSAGASTAKKNVLWLWSLLEHVATVGVLVRVVILRHLEVSFPDLRLVVVTLG